MFEALRRLTADYTPAEYEAWLYDDYLKDIPKGQNVFAIPSISEDDSFKDIACALSEVADATGYEAEFLYEMFSESVRDGQTRKEAFDSVATISYEQDW